MNLGNGLLMYKPEIEDFLKEIYDKHKFLWSEEREQIIKEFVKTDPLTVDIRDKFIYYDNITTDLENMDRNQIIGAIEIRMSKTILFTKLKVQLLFLYPQVTPLRHS